jgi:hypothetical protein
MTRHHRVAIVFDEHASTLLLALADRCHVWLVESEENAKAAQSYWARSRAEDSELASGVTTFARGAGMPEQALDMALELVEDHHGEFAHDPPLSEVLIVGLDPTNAVLGVLREWGFIEIQSSVEGLLGKKAT